MSGDIPDELEELVTSWFHKHIEDEVYSEALYELFKILDENEIILWTRVLEAEEDTEEAQHERDMAQDETFVMEKYRDRWKLAAKKLFKQLK